MMNSSPSLPPQSLWITRLLKKPENVFMCAVDESFIRDKFNLIGLDDLVPNYESALRIVLDVNGNGVVTGRDEQAAAELLYGLVHARFVMTSRGVAKMLEKYAAGRFGHCPRVNCERSSVLPIGLYDMARKETVKLYCPRCMDVYAPAAGIVGATVDGAYFGTGFPHMVFMTQPECRPSLPKGRYITKLYGFRVHDSAANLQRLVAIGHEKLEPATTTTHQSTSIFNKYNRQAAEPQAGTSQNSSHIDNIMFMYC